MAFNIEKEKALSVALMIHGVNFFPVILAGFYYLWRDNLSITEMSNRTVREDDPVGE